MKWTVAELFSGCGGMATGFVRRPPFEIVAAVDAEHGKPCEGSGVLDCNATYARNVGLQPLAKDIGTLTSADLADVLSPLRRGELTVLIACPPCTDFSRAKPSNHLSDGERNGLVTHVASFVDALLPEFVVMENARELMAGHHTHHAELFMAELRRLGYSVSASVHMLSRFGLPQIRERALILAARDVPVKGLDDLWGGYGLRREAVTVRGALNRLDTWHRDNPDDPMNIGPGFTDVVRARIAATPPDGGSWFDLASNPQTANLLTRSMKHRWAIRDLGSHPDVYGRMSWDRPAPTIKRECAHVGNGRYAHPIETRMLTVREMATLQGFPFDYLFPARTVANRYRHIGDAVPPMISYQISGVIAWMKAGKRPTPSEWVLPQSALTAEDVMPIEKAAAA